MESTNLYMTPKFTKVEFKDVEPEINKLNKYIIIIIKYLALVDFNVGSELGR